VGLVIKTDAQVARPGSDNLIVAVFLERTQAELSRGTPQRQNRRVSLGVLPAVPIEIVAE